MVVCVPHGFLGSHCLQPDQATSSPVSPSTASNVPLATHKDRHVPNAPGTELTSNAELHGGTQQVTQAIALRHTGEESTVSLSHMGTGEIPEAAQDTQLHQRKNQTHFCIRIYYLKDSLKIKIKARK